MLPHDIHNFHQTGEHDEPASLKYEELYTEGYVFELDVCRLVHSIVCLN